MPASRDPSIEKGLVASAVVGFECEDAHRMFFALSDSLTERKLDHVSVGVRNPAKVAHDGPALGRRPRPGDSVRLRLGVGGIDFVAAVDRDTQMLPGRLGVRRVFFLQQHDDEFGWILAPTEPGDTDAFLFAFVNHLHIAIASVESDGGVDIADLQCDVGAFHGRRLCAFAGLFASLEGPTQKGLITSRVSVKLVA